jgi:hypothetical protein
MGNDFMTVSGGMTMAMSDHEGFERQIGAP